MLYVARGSALLISGGSSFVGLSGDEAHGNLGLRLCRHRAMVRPAGSDFRDGCDRRRSAPLSPRAPYSGVTFMRSAGTSARRRARACACARSRSRFTRSPARALGSRGFCWLRSFRRRTQRRQPTTNSRRSPPSCLEARRFLAAGVQWAVRSPARFVIGFLNDGLVLSNVSEFWQMVATGLVIVVAVGIDEFQRLGSARLSARRRLRAAGRKISRLCLIAEV